MASVNIVKRCRQMSFRTVAVCTGLAVLVGAIGSARQARRSSEAYLDGLLARITALASERFYTTLNPSTDVRIELLRRNPQLAEQAEEILTRSGHVPKSSSELNTLVQYFGVLGDHEAVMNLVRDSAFAPSIETLDFLYLLPAYLYEHLGVRDLALANYGRYVELARQVSIKTNAFTSVSFQRRLTVTRVKLAFLRQAIPSIRSQYYRASYFGALLSDFLEEEMQEHFLRKYVDGGILRRPENDPEEIEFDPYPLSDWIAGLPGLDVDPYAHFELCAASLMWHVSVDPECRSEELSNRRWDIHMLPPMAAFVRARLSDNVEEAAEIYWRLGYGPKHEAEFLRDDARFFLGILYLNQGKEFEAKVALTSVLRDFRTGGYDAVTAAEWVLRNVGWGLK